MSSPQSAVQAAATGVRPTRVRHRILALAVAAYMITYMDRAVIASAVPSIQREFGFSLVTITWILGSFRWGYALFQIPGGWLGDRYGPRRALSLIVTWWSLFTSMTVLAWNAVSMAILRFLFGMGESGAFPIATRAMSRWILPSERGFAQGVTHAGSRLGAAFTPPLVVLIITAYGWRAAFLSFGVLGIIWAAAWFYYYRDSPKEHKGANAAERDLITSAIGPKRFGGDGRVPWRAILSSPVLWYTSLMYFCYSYCIAVYLDLFPTYLKAHRGFSLAQMGIYAALPLAAGALGNLLGGWASDELLRRGVGLKMARRSVGFLGFVVAGAAMGPAALTRDPIMCVWLSCVTVFALEVTVGVSWAIPLDIAAEYAASTSSVMNMSGNIGGALSPTLFGYLVQGFGWNAPFLLASAMCCVAALFYFKIDASRSIFPAKV